MKTEAARSLRTSTESSRVRIYGIPIEEIHDPALGPILEGDERYPFRGIVYCGFKLGSNEVRIPSNRLWYLRRVDVETTGEQPDFVVDGKSAKFYEVSLNAIIKEKTYQRVQLGAEITIKPTTLGALLAVRPENCLDVESIKGQSREQLEAMVADFIEGGGGAQPLGQVPIVKVPRCNTWGQSYRATVYDPFVRADEDGADCDE
jgi:hypothetical protein